MLQTYVSLNIKKLFIILLNRHQLYSLLGQLQDF